MDITKILNEMTLEEKANFVSGSDFWHTQNIDRLGVKALLMTDGPHGVRMEADQNADISAEDDGVLNTSNLTYKSTCFPTACATGSSWDKWLVCEIGDAIGKECKAKGISIILGPGINIKRSPLCGRNFEYFSEDPFLAGTLASGFVHGVQSNGVGACVKHFAANSQETRRLAIDSVVDDQALNEIYLRAFEMAVKEEQPWAIMCSYNKINGIYASDNEFLLTEKLRNEWGFDGIVMSDWGAVNDRVQGIKAGLDLEMPGVDNGNAQRIIDAVNNGILDVKELDKVVERLLKLVDKGTKNFDKSKGFDAKAHHELAIKAASESAVLLKNDDNILPLNKDKIKNKKIAIIGAFAEKARYEGGGSSHVEATKIEDVLSSMKKRNVDFTFSKGYDSIYANNELISEAVKNASNADIAVVFAGMPDEFESEGYDREHMRMSESHLELIEKVAQANENTVVVLMLGSPVELPFNDKVKAILNMNLGGQGVAEAAVKLLLGEVSPSGKLAESYTFKMEDTSCYGNFPGGTNSVHYREGVFVGYRYYDTKNVEVQYPFGFGLSYSEFEYKNLNINGYKVELDVKNVGSFDAKEIVQVYVAPPKTAERPNKELKAFAKIALKAGETKHIELELDDRAFMYYDIDDNKFEFVDGEYKILVGASSKDIRLEGSITINKGGKKEYHMKPFEERFKKPVPPLDFVKEGEFTWSNTLEQMMTGEYGKKVYDEMMGLAKEYRRKQGKNDDILARENAEIYEVIMRMPFRAYHTMARRMIGPDKIERFVNMANGKDE